MFVSKQLLKSVILILVYLCRFRRMCFETEYILCE